MATSWGYGEQNGPCHWQKWFPIAASGQRQSPIDIKTSSCLSNDKMKEVMAKYTPLAGLRLENTGASWMLKMDQMTSSLTGGPLDSEYRAAQMHAHWGSKDGQGSEHTVDGVSYDAELHIVHFNTKYGDLATAVDKPDGLAVLGMFLKLGEEHQELEKICQSLEDIQMKQEATALQDTIDPVNFLPESKSYYTYPGSLTTPPLLESVTWIVFKQPVEVSRQQILSMRELSSSCEDDEALITENCRGTCSLGDRVVTVYVKGGEGVSEVLEGEGEVAECEGEFTEGEGEVTECVSDGLEITKSIESNYAIVRSLVCPVTDTNIIEEDSTDENKNITKDKTEVESETNIQAEIKNAVDCQVIETDIIEEANTADNKNIRKDDLDKEETEVKSYVSLCETAMIEEENTDDNINIVKDETDVESEAITNTDIIEEGTYNNKNITKDYLENETNGAGEDVPGIEGDVLKTDKTQEEIKNTIEESLECPVTETEENKTVDNTNLPEAEDKTGHDTFNILVPVCIASLAVAIPLAVYMATRK